MVSVNLIIIIIIIIIMIDCGIQYMFIIMSVGVLFLLDFLLCWLLGFAPGKVLLRLMYWTKCWAEYVVGLLEFQLILLEL